MDFTLPHAFDNYTVAQKRTGVTKHFVFLVEDVVYKGPYKKADKAFNNVLARSLIFNEWKTPCVVKALDYVETPDGIFIRFPNLLTGMNFETETHQEEFSDLKYRIVKNSPVIDILEVLNDNLWIFNQVEDLLVALCHCYILGVGDMNLRNCLVDLQHRMFYLISFDETRSVEGEGSMFYFNKPPAKKYGWGERVSGHYHRVAERLALLRNDSVIISQGLLNRLERTIQLLIQHARASPVPLSPNIETLTVSPTQPVSLTPVGMQIKSAPIGQMVWKGLRGGATKTYSGIDFDVAKSALQKYIRRQMTQKAILTGIEIFRLGEVGGESAVTNLFNRLAIIANEDIGPANYPLVLEVTRLIESGIRDVNTLVVMIQLLAESPKTRMMSHAWSAYATPEGRAISLGMKLPIDTAFTEADLKYIALNKNSDIFVSSDPESIRPYVLIFLKRLQEKDFNAYSWAYYFLESSKNITLAKRRKFIQKSPRSMTGKVDILLWAALGKVLAPETHDILVEAYYNHVEGRPFLQNAILMAVSGITTHKVYDIHPSIQIWKQTPVINQMLNGDFKLVITRDELNYIADVHTAAGKKNGKTTKQFVEEGALVIPQDPNFYNEILASIYKQGCN
jgi:hypothetical protein